MRDCRKQPVLACAPFLVLPIVALATAGCDEGRDASYGQAQGLMPAVHLDSGLAYVSPDMRKVWVARWDEAAAGPVVSVHGIGRSAKKAVASADGGRLFVLCHGAAEGTVRQADVEPESLHVIDAAAGTDVVYTLGNPFTDLAESPSGRWVVLFFRTDMAGTNPNLMAVVDMDAPPSETNPGIISIRTLGSIPRGIVMAEGMKVAVESAGGGSIETEDLALVLSDSYITLFDLEHTDRSEITVPLVVPGSGGTVIPAAEDVIVASDPQGLNSRIIMRADNTSDIYSLTLVGVDTADPLGNEYRVSLNQLSVDVNPHDAPTDMDLFEDGGRQMVLVTTASADSFAVVDPETTMVTTISVDFRVASGLVFDEGRQALLYSQGEDMAYFLDLSGVVVDRERNLDEFALSGRVESLEPVPQKDYAVMLVDEHPGKLFVLDLVGRQMHLINLFSSTASTELLMFPDGDRILLDPGGLEEVWFVGDMESFQIERIILDAVVRDVALLPEAGPDGKIVVDHGHSEGYLTFLDMADPRRSTATSIRGFLLGGVLDAGRGE